MTQALLIGYGNPLRSDDGFGWYAAEALSRHYSNRPEIRVIACQQLTPDLADDISAAELVVFVDASCTVAPGMLKIDQIDHFDDRQAASYTHHLSPAMALGICRDLWGRTPRAFLVTAGAFHFEGGEALSPELQFLLDRTISQIAALVS